MTCEISAYSYTRYVSIGIVLTGMCQLSLGSLKAHEFRVTGADYFETKIRPLLEKRCYQCHSAKASLVEGNLQLDSRTGWEEGGHQGPAVVPGEPEKSLLIEAVRHESDDLRMPPDQKLAADEIDVLVEWVKIGAPGPKTDEPVKGSKAAVALDRSHWSFKLPQRHVLPNVKQLQWVSQPIDAFVLAALENAALSPNEPADKRTLIRRAAFVATGLPPAPELVEAFLTEKSTSAYEQIVDELLASPQFGEHWARHWMDVARYGEDQADDAKRDSYAHAWKYRDWLVQALNQDLPYDQFVRLQLAADLVPNVNAADLTALGFLSLGPRFPDGMDVIRKKADEWDDRIDVVTRGLMGLTVSCARCHDHKYDPIPISDYYSLAGVFASTDYTEIDIGRGNKVHAVADTKNPHDLPIFVRGEPSRRGAVVPRRFLGILSDGEPPAWTKGSGRLELANAITSAGNPLTARVLVNRVWGECFGEPLVSTSSNLGKLGSLPSHPELLDDTAARFVEGGWSIKGLIRELLLSSTFRQSSKVNRTVEKDPENRLLWRMNRRRLTIEQWRDSVLMASGQLDLQQGGPSVAGAADAKNHRRTIYTRVSRHSTDPLLTLFDFPDPSITHEGRNESSTPLQDLFLLNNPFMVNSAKSLVEQQMSDSMQNDNKCIEAIYLRLFARPPTSNELQVAINYLTNATDVEPKLDREQEVSKSKRKWQLLVHGLLASSEMMFID